MNVQSVEIANHKYARSTPMAKTAVYSMVFKVVFTGLNLIASVLLARSLGTAGYGVYAYALAVVNMLMILTQMGLPPLLVREFAAYAVHRDWPKMQGLLKRSGQLMIVSNTAIIISAVAIALWVGDPTEEVIQTFLIALILLPLLTLGNLRGASLRGLHCVLLGQLPEQLLRPAFLVLGILVCLFFFGMDGLTPQLAITVNAVAAATAFVVGAILLWRYLPREIKRAEAEYDTGRWINSALSLAMLAGIQILDAQAGILVLGIFRDHDEVGVYRVATQGALLVGFTLQSMNMALGPHMSKLYAQGKMDSLQQTVTWAARLVLVGALPLALLFLFFGREILVYVFGESFESGYIVLAVLTVGQLINALSGPNGILLNMSHNERLSVMGVVVAVAVNIGLCFLLVPFWGGMGAGIATAVSMVVWNIMGMVFVYRKLGIITHGIGRIR